MHVERERGEGERASPVIGGRGDPTPQTSSSSSPIFPPSLAQISFSSSSSSSRRKEDSALAIPPEAPPAVVRPQMGSSLSSASSQDDEGSEGYPVILNVYDLTDMNDYMFWCGLGIFHSGIQVHGLEYGYGAHDYPTSGVFEVEPRSCPGFIYKCSILLGHINMLQSEFRTLVEHMAEEYHGDMYHLIYKNCNHFTNDVSFRLTGTCIPGWVNRLARMGATCSCLLPESLQLPVVKQASEYQLYSEEEGSEYPSIVSAHEPTESDDTDQDRHLLSPTSVGEVTFIKECNR